LRIEGILRISEFERLRDRLTDSQGEIHVNLAFDLQSGQPVVDGHVSGQLGLLCQRCMNTMTLDIDDDIHLGLVQSEQEIDGLLPGYEPLLVAEEPMKVQDIIEDEILLLLPMIPSHPDGECGHIEGFEQTDESVDIVEEEKDNPFSTLANLKKH
jgi:uncharacterized protein